MRPRRTLARLLVVTLLLRLVGTASAGGSALSSSDLEFFEAEVRPILVARCDSCHSAKAKKVRGHLLLDSLPDSTFVAWNGKFGRLPIVQKGGTGRDNNSHAFTTWMAGGGVKGNTHHGETGEFGHEAILDRVSVNGLHATLLHLLGLGHTRLTFTTAETSACPTSPGASSLKLLRILRNSIN